MPGGSEALLLYDISLGYPHALLLITATLGNTLGSIINYFLGLKGIAYFLNREKHLEKARGYFQRYGAWALLLCWVPIIGDPITLIAGILGYDVKKFIMIVFLTKGLRYIMLVWIFS